MATNLNHQWMPFTDNREFQRAPQLFVRAEGVRYWSAEPWTDISFAETAIARALEYVHERGIINRLLRMDEQHNA